MFLKSSSFYCIVLCFIGGAIFAQPSVELTGNTQARPGFGAGLKIKIARNGITGLMRFVSTIPENCSASELKVYSSTLSTNNNELRIIWLSVPLRDTIFQEWELKIPENAKGKYVISGQLEYFVEGVKKTVPSNSLEINLTPYFTRYLEEK
jgi:hypothetical protein